MQLVEGWSFSVLCSVPCVMAPSTVDELLGSFQFFGVKNSAGMKGLVHAFPWRFLVVYTSEQNCWVMGYAFVQL